MAASPRLLALVADGRALARRIRVEIRGIASVEKAPTAEHADALLGLGEVLRHNFHRLAGSGATRGGWWILPEVDIEMENDQIVRPDLAGWRRERVPERPRGRPLRARPDWVCEVLSKSNADHDVVSKVRVFHRHAVPHYWLVDPEREVLTAHRWTRQGYFVSLQADRWQFVRAEPFDSLEIQVGSLFGEESEP